MSDVSRNEPRTFAAGVAVINCRRKSNGSHIIPSIAIASMLGLISTETLDGLLIARNVDNELISLCKAVKASQTEGKWDRDPLELHSNHNTDSCL